MKRYVKRVWLVSLLWSFLLICTGLADVAEDRASVKKMLKDGNWKEAYDLSKKLLTNVSDEKSDDDFQATKTAMQNLNIYKEFDQLITIVREKHWDNSETLNVAAAALLYTPHHGQWIDNKFERAGGWRRGGEYANSQERDRVESLQLYQRAYTIEQDEKKKAAIVQGWANTIQWQRSHSQSWRLQILTDTEKLPEIERGRTYYGGTRGAPMTEDGGPLFYEIPATYAEAKNDGERWRWLLMEAVKLNADYKQTADRIWASFLQNQFGVHTLQTFSWYGRYMQNQDEEDKSGIMQVHTLKDDETVCRLANGVKRFKLPQSQNFIQIYKNLWESGDAYSGDQLVTIYLNRRQYIKAAKLLGEIIESKGDDKNKSRQKRLDQITKDWGRFEAIGKPFTPDEEKTVTLVYRNAKEIELTLHEVDTQGIADGIWTYLQSNPLSVDWNTTRWNNMLYDLLNGKRNKFIGEQVAAKTYQLKPRDNHWDTRAELTLPEIKKAGAYLLRGETKDGKKFYTLIWIDNLTIVSRSVKGGTWYYVTDSLTGDPISEATLTFRGYEIKHLNKRQGKRRINVLTKSFTKQTNNQGQVFIKNKDRNHQWMVHASSGDKKAWLGLNRIWSWYNDNHSTWNNTRAFGITSQPVYKPNSKVEGKFWARQARYDLGDKSTFAGVEARIRIHDPRGQQFGKDIIVRSDQYGGIPFSIDIPEDAALGAYRVSVSKKGGGLGFNGYLSFRIEKYKKPEYSVSVDAPSEPVKLGDTFEATVKANYYHGAPVTNAKVKVKIVRHDHTQLWFPYSRWDWLYGSGYGWLDIERPWYPGWYRWGCRCPQPFWYHRGWQQPELILEKELKIGPDGTVKVKVDTSLTKLVHGNKDHRYEITAEVIDASRRTIFGKGSVLAARKPFNVTVWLNRGYALTGEKITTNIAARTLDGRKVKGTGTAVLNRVSFDKDGKLKETEISKWELKQLPEGFEHIDFKADKAGQYRLVVKVKDEKDREIEGAVLFTVRGVNGEEGDVRYNDLELIVDKREYAPDDKVKLLINTKRKNSTVVLFVRGTEDRRTIKLEGHSTVVELPVTLKDMPNFFVDAVTVSDAQIHTQVREIIVPPQKRILNVEVLPNNERYKPREKGTVKIRVTGLDGEPVKGACALAIYDKSLEYISGGSNVAEIKSFFWKWRRHYRNTGWTTSFQYSPASMVKRGKIAMQHLGVFGHSLSMDFDKEDSFGGIGGGAPILSKAPSRGMAPPAPESAPMLQEGLADNASLGRSERKKKEAAGASDGNAAPEVMIRKDFADMIKWSGSVELDENGVATVPVDYPDNLTTWKIKTWAVAPGTRVGEGSAEVITSKDLIIRLQAPRFFVEKDEVVLSAVVHNYHKDAKKADVVLELEGGTLTTDDALLQNIELAAKNGEQRVNWRVKVTQEGVAIIRMKVLTDGDSDAMEMTFPVYVHGILKQMAWSRTVENGKPNVKFDITVPEERRPEESRLEIRYSPTVAGAMVDALPYLAEYPYGCTEQTLNRFVPTVITQKLLKDMGIDLEAVRNKRTNLNPQELSDDKERAKQWKRWQRNPVFSQKEVNKMVRKGVERLVEMQNNDGGWGWFSGYGEHSYPHTTAVVVHGLSIAKKNGASIPDGVIQNGVAWLKRYEARETEKIRMWKKRDKNTKPHPDARDAFVRVVLAENGISNKEMLGYQFRDKNHYGVYAKSLLGMSLHLAKDVEKRDAVIRNIEQYLTYDEENQTAYLEMRNNGYWWCWYGSEFEAHAWYLKLLAAVKPKSKEAQGLVKYLINNRKHATYWNSTRDTAYCIEAIADYMKASGESDPNVEVEVLVGGKSYKKVKITKENLFSFDNKVTLAGDILTGGKHTVEIRRTGEGPLYTNAYLTVFTKEDFIKKAGLEVKVERRFYKLVRKKDATKDVAGDHGQVVNQKVDKYDRIPLKVGDKVTSEDIIEVELIMESKNDYEYLMFADFKAAGMEAEKVRSGYMRTGNMYAYMEVHDEKVCFFVRQLHRGKHSLTYRLRAEIPGKFSALPAMAEAMYAPELKANSDEMKVEILENEE